MSYKFYSRLVLCLLYLLILHSNVQTSISVYSDPWWLSHSIKRIHCPSDCPRFACTAYTLLRTRVSVTSRSGRKPYLPSKKKLMVVPITTVMELAMTSVRLTPEKEYNMCLLKTSFGMSTGKPIQASLARLASFVTSDEILGEFPLWGATVCNLAEAVALTSLT